MRRIRVDLRRIRRRPRTLESNQRIRRPTRPCLGPGANPDQSSRFTENSAAPSDTRNQAANPRPETTLPRPRRQCGEFESIYGEFARVDQYFPKQEPNVRKLFSMSRPQGSKHFIN